MTRTSATLSRPATSFSTYEAPIAPPIREAEKRSFTAHVMNDPWLIPKLGAMALVAAPAIFALAVTGSSESFGVMLGIIPDMLAVIVVAWGMLGSLLFLDGYLEDHAGA
jgi:hypothetical protein